MTTFGRDDSISVADLKRIIDRAWWDLRYTLSGDTRDLDRALEIEMKDERAHRSRGRNFCSSSFTPSYKVGVEYAAKAFILRWIYEAPLSVDLADMGSLRPAVLHAYSVAARMRRSVTRGENACSHNLWEKWRTLVVKSQYAQKWGVIGQPVGTSTIIAGVVDQIPNKQKRLQQICMARAEYKQVCGEESGLGEPIFMMIDYSKDIAANG